MLEELRGKAVIYDAKKQMRGEKAEATKLLEELIGAGEVRSVLDALPVAVEVGNRRIEMVLTAEAPEATDPSKMRIPLVGYVERNGNKVVAFRRDINVYRYAQVTSYVEYGESDKSNAIEILKTVGVKLSRDGHDLAKVDEALKALLSYLSEKDVEEILNSRDLPAEIKEKVEKAYKELVEEGGWKSEAEKKGISVKWGVEEGRLVFTVGNGKVEVKVKFEVGHEIEVYIITRSTPPSGVDASVWGEYNKEVDKTILAAIFKALRIEKDKDKIGDKQVYLTKDDLEKLRVLKAVDEALRRWSGGATSLRRDG